jgi:hypothetical protein
LLGVLGTIVWLGLNAMLWYARPPDLYWLIGSLILSVVYGYAFFRYVMRQK